MQDYANHLYIYSSSGTQIVGPGAPSLRKHQISVLVELVINLTTRKNLDFLREISYSSYSVLLNVRVKGIIPFVAQVKSLLFLTLVTSSQFEKQKQVSLFCRLQIPYYTFHQM